MKKAGLLSGIVLSALFLTLLAGCTAGQPQKPAEQVIKDGLSNLSSVTSAKYDLSMKGDVTAENTGKMNFDLAINGGFDVKMMKEPKITFKMVVKANDNTGKGGNADLEMRLNKDMLYFIVSDLNAGKDMPLPTELTSLFKRWWSFAIPAEMMEELGTSATSETSAETPEQAKIRKMFEESNLFTKPVFVGSENVGGKSSYHYTVTVDKPGMIAFFKKAAEEQGQTVSEEEMKKAEEQFQKMDMTGDIWIGSQSGVMTQMKGALKMTGTGDEPSGTVNFSFTLSDINKGYTVTIPAPTEEFTMDKIAPLIQMMQGGSMGLETLPAEGTETSGETVNPEFEGISG